MTKPTAEQLEVTDADEQKALADDIANQIIPPRHPDDDIGDHAYRMVAYRAALLAIQSTEARMAAAVEWQDIAIAPRDGTKFLAFQPGKSGACVVRARTDAMRVDFYRQPQADVCWQELPEARYSHWMPLPPPPTIRSATDG